MTTEFTDAKNTARCLATQRSISIRTKKDAAQILKQPFFRERDHVGKLQSNIYLITLEMAQNLQEVSVTF